MNVAQRAVASVVLLATAISGYPGVPVDAAEPAAALHGRRAAVDARPGWAAPGPHAAEAHQASGRGRAAPPSRTFVRPAPPTGLRGIDVSHHQGRIDWARVARSGHHFVIAKATEGHTFVDPTYGRNKARAEAHHLAFGAYHFARPDPREHDAIREANHFLDVAALEPGNVIPVLDLETTGGLSRRRLTRWILTWLGRVHERLGVRPMIYTSPIGWALRTGDTTAVAEAGYDVLWVAHWGVRRPALPARDWGGHGWTMWQRSACGSVPGIRGCVDVDVLADRSLQTLTIVQPDRAAPSIRLRTPAELTGAVSIVFDEVVAGIRPHNVLLRAESTQAHVPLTLSCRSGVDAAVDCVAGDVRSVVATPRRPLVPGERYQALVNPAGVVDVVADRAGNAAPARVRTFRAPTDLEQGSAAIVFGRPNHWDVHRQRERRGGRVAVSEVPGASAELTFHGTGLVWRTVRGPNHGPAQLWVDGRLLRTVDTYAKERSLGVRERVVGLPLGLHSIRIVVLGHADQRAVGAGVAIDGLRVLSAASGSWDVTGADDATGVG